MSQAHRLVLLLGTTANLMSKANPSLSNETADIEHYVKVVLPSYKGLVEVRLWGSRSPNKAKQSRPDSDWDLLAVWEKPTLIPSPKLLTNGLAVDLCSVSVDRYKEFSEKETVSVQVYPADDHGVF